MVSSLTNPLGLSRITSHWWVPLLRGIVAVIFGVVILLYPISSVFVLVVLFGAFMFVDGILNIVTALRFAHPTPGTGGRFCSKESSGLRSAWSRSSGRASRR